MNKLHNDELIKAVQAWVIGQLYQLVMPGQIYHGQFNDQNGVLDHNRFLDFALRTTTVVYRYIRGQQKLDGTCSDMDCHLATQAKYIFEHHLDTKHVMVDKAAYQLVTNALERDVQEGKVIRGEILEELKSKTY